MNVEKSVTFEKLVPNTDRATYDVFRQSILKAELIYDSIETAKDHQSALLIMNGTNPVYTIMYTDYKSKKICTKELSIPNVKNITETNRVHYRLLPDGMLYVTVRRDYVENKVRYQEDSIGLMTHNGIMIIEPQYRAINGMPGGIMLGITYQSTAFGFYDYFGNLIIKRTGKLGWMVHDVKLNGKRASFILVNSEGKETVIVELFIAYDGNLYELFKTESSVLGGIKKIDDNLVVFTTSVYKRDPYDAERILREMKKIEYDKKRNFGTQA